MPIKEIFKSIHQGKIWKLYYDKYSDYLLLEERNEECREAHFYCYDINSFAGKEIHVYQEEDWWLGVHDFQYGVAIFHLYQDGIEPIPQGVLAMDVVTEDVLFRRDEVKFDVLEENKLFFFEGEHHEKKEVSLMEWDLYQERVSVSREVLSPLYYTEESTHYQTFTSFLKKLSGIEPTGGIEYLEYGERIFLSFNSMVEKKIQNMLFIIKDNGDIEQEIILNGESNGIGMGTFFLLDHRLWFVQDTHQLNVFSLV